MGNVGSGSVGQAVKRMDREKVLTWLEICGKNRDCSGCCPYGDGTGEDAASLCREYLMEDALSLLKEQEAVKPILEQDSMVCGVCGHEVIWQKMLGEGILADEKLDYCPHCGRKVKWE